MNENPTSKQIEIELINLHTAEPLTLPVRQLTVGVTMELENWNRRETLRRLEEEGFSGSELEKQAEAEPFEKENGMVPSFLKIVRTLWECAPRNLTGGWKAFQTSFFSADVSEPEMMARCQKNCAELSGPAFLFWYGGDTRPEKENPEKTSEKKTEETSSPKKKKKP
jgi:hypothetical protein